MIKESMSISISKVVFGLVTLSLLFVAGLFFYGEPSQKEFEFKQLKKLGVEYSREYSMFDEFKTEIQQAYRAYFDAPSYDQVALGLEIMLREERFPDLTKAALAAIAEDKVEFTGMLMWHQSVIISAERFINLSKIDKKLFLAIQQNDTCAAEKIAAEYSIKVFHINDAVRLAGYFIPAVNK